MDKPQPPVHDDAGERVFERCARSTTPVISNLTREGLFQAMAGALRRVISFGRTAIFRHGKDTDAPRLSGA